MKIIWLDLAVQDLSAVETYIAKDKPSAAIKVVLRIIEAVEIIFVRHILGDEEVHRCPVIHVPDSLQVGDRRAERLWRCTQYGCVST